MKRFWISLLLMLALTLPGKAATYYVDATYGEGGNGSQATPWDDLSDITGLAAGDTVKLRRARIWREALPISNSGTSGSPITFTFYDVGADPIISGSALLTPGSGNHWTLSGGGTSEYYWNATGLTEPYAVWLNGTNQTKGTLGSLADHNWGWGNNDTLGYNTVYFKDVSGDPDTTGVTVESAKLGNLVAASGYSWLVFDTLEFRQTNPGTGMLYFANATNIIIQNCTLHDAVYRVLYCDATSSNLTVNNNAIYNVLNSTYSSWIDLVHLAGVTTASIFRNNMFGNLSTNGAMLIVGGASSSVVIEKNYIGSSAGRNVIFQETATGNTLRYNLIRDGTKGVYFASTAGANKAYANLLVDLNIAILVGDGFATTNDLIYNNTIYNEAHADYPGIKVVGSHAGTTIKNNIVWVKNNGGTGYAVNVDTTGPVLNNNRYHNSGSSSLTRWLTTNYTEAQFGSYQTASGQDAASTVGDPSFTDRGAVNLTLASNSPCRDTGTNLGSPYDIALSPATSYGDWLGTVATLDQDDYTPWEQGAYVYTTTGGGSNVPVISIRYRD